MRSLKTLLFIAVLFCLNVVTIKAQTTTTPDTPNFTAPNLLIDSNKVIGKFNGRNYFRYECEPGHHLFWAKSENRDFIEANLLAGKIYFIEALPTIGIMKSAVQLHQINPTSKRMKVTNKLLMKRKEKVFDQQKLDDWTTYWNQLIQNSLTRYIKRRAEGKEKKELDSNLFYTIN